MCCALSVCSQFRKLFQMYDKEKTGSVHVEDFRNMAEQFGMQLDDDSLLALYNVSVMLPCLTQISHTQTKTHTHTHRLHILAAL